MSEVAAIGALPQVGGFALAGVRVYPADTAEQARGAWDVLPPTVGVVILTVAAAEALDQARAAPSTRLTIVMPP